MAAEQGHPGKEHRSHHVGIRCERQPLTADFKDARVMLGLHSGLNAAANTRRMVRIRRPPPPREQDVRIVAIGNGQPTIEWL
jgi:hypothetical protein